MFWWGRLVNIEQKLDQVLALEKQIATNQLLLTKVIPLNLRIQLNNIEEDVQKVLQDVKQLLPKPVVGIEVVPGYPIERCSEMAKCTVKYLKKSQAGGMKARALKSGEKIGDFLIFDNEDSTCTVFGVDAGGNQVDISSVASITETSSDPTTLSVSTTQGVTFKLSGLKPGSATISTTATWNDGSIGPFSFDLPCTCQGTAATGITVVPGTPVPR